MKVLLKIIAALCVAVGLFGCQSTESLSGHSGMRKAKGGGEYYLVEGQTLKGYQTVYIDSVMGRFQADSKALYIDPDDYAMLKEHIVSSVEKALGDAYPIVDTPQSDTLALRIAITDLVPGDPALYMAFQAPGVRLLSTAKKLSKGSGIGVGEAAIEVEMLDGATGDQIAIFVDRKVGGNLRVDQGITEWGHIKGAFESWAQRLRDKMEEVNA